MPPTALRPKWNPSWRGIKPAVIAIILAALWKLGRSALKSVSLVPIGIGVVTALLVGVV